MKANEFIKKFGLDCAKQELIVMQEAQLGNNHQYYIDNLKRLIDAHDFVDELGSLENAKIEYENRPFDHVWSDLGKAIADVESCL